MCSSKPKTPKPPKPTQAPKQAGDADLINAAKEAQIAQSNQARDQSGTLLAGKTNKAPEVQPKKALLGG